MTREQQVAVASVTAGALAVWLLPRLSQAAPPGPLVATFTATLDGLDVTVDARASTGPIATHQWNFGDGATTTGQRATHTYAEAGSYPITLTVTATDGRTATEQTFYAVGLDDGYGRGGFGAGPHGDPVTPAATAPPQ